ncbi:nucleotidyltransferase domain-containing protein [Paenibacillus lemnae]|uniref:Nucleotidyltransferase domain-containing protein n=1 Tax=Paenibacillus lemnae TaxID=1330551 RepID=A0A848M6J3_PAELE|nr:nucleotidyltransferase domain-containing protein [Paenibacillus lemnae]NMO96607.1 nucleotidyltransferase domain-containing protein [Paenibacillus lemnae]
MNQQAVLDQVTSLLRDALSNSVAGIYLHGSMAMGGFNPAQSDIDILVIIGEKQPIEIYKGIALKLIQLEDEMKLVKGFELSIVLKTYADQFEYPTPFEFHYSSFHKEKYRTDENYLCGSYQDPDLAAHFMITYHRGVVLFGKPIKSIIKPVDKHFYMDSIVSQCLVRYTDERNSLNLNQEQLINFLNYMKREIDSEQSPTKA